MLKKFTEFRSEKLNELELQEKSKLQQEYQEFFKSKLDKYGVSSPAELSTEDKAKFFDEIETEWDKDKNEAVKPAVTPPINELKNVADVSVGDVIVTTDGKRAKVLGKISDTKMTVKVKGEKDERTINLEHIDSIAENEDVDITEMLTASKEEVTSFLETTREFLTEEQISELEEVLAVEDNVVNIDEALELSADELIEFMTENLDAITPEQKIVLQEALVSKLEVINEAAADFMATGDGVSITLKGAHKKMSEDSANELYEKLVGIVKEFSATPVSDIVVKFK